MTHEDDDAHDPTPEPQDAQPEEKVQPPVAASSAPKHKRRRSTRAHPQTSSGEDETETSEAEGTAVRATRRTNSVRVVVNTAREPYPPPIKKKEVDEEITPKAPDGGQQISTTEYIGMALTGIAAGAALAYGIVRLLK